MYINEAAAHTSSIEVCAAVLQAFSCTLAALVYPSRCNLLSICYFLCDKDRQFIFPMQGNGRKLSPPLPTFFSARSQIPWKPTHIHLLLPHLLPGDLLYGDG